MILTKTYPASKSVNNVFNEFFNAFPATWESNVKANTSAPVNILESESGFHLDFNVPGRNKEDFKIALDNGLLTVSYEKKDQKEQEGLKAVRKEFSFPGFQRSFTLNEKINVEGIEARYESGILKIYLPKKEEVKNSPKQISIQ